MFATVHFKVECMSLHLSLFHVCKRSKMDRGNFEVALKSLKLGQSCFNYKVFAGRVLNFGTGLKMINSSTPLSARVP